VPSRIEDYALIGDTQTAALIGKDGSIDWMCMPRFDSEACFAALLGDERHGRWRLAPVGAARAVRRRYLPGTLVLETETEVDGGAVRVIDFMPPRDTTPDVARIIEGVRGQVRVRMELVIRFESGAIVPWVRRLAGGDLLAVAGPDALLLHTPVETHGEGLKTVAEWTLAEGQRVPFILTWFPSHQRVPPPALDAEQQLAETLDYWREWSSLCTYRGPYRDEVDGSLRVLKALTYAPTGAIVAAPTTSLPEKLGGARNWDYRYAWLRDSTFTLYALLLGGHREEAEAWREWLLRAVAGDTANLQIMYGVGGERRLPEREASWLPGYEGSRPVRMGNRASEQLQLDVYGEVIDTLYQATRAGVPPSEWAWRLQRAILDSLEGKWREPDEGIWEVRGPRRHFTHSKMMAWVAFDRAVRFVEEFPVGHDGPVARWRALRDQIHAEVCARGWNPQLQSFVQEYGGSDLDASLLMMPLVGFLPARDERVRGTVAAIERHLMRDGLVWRYATREELDGLPPGEGTFLACSFWLADNHALAGRFDAARALFERLLALRNDVGLLAEEIDPRTGRHLGNFPQALSHLGLVNSACNLTNHQPIAPAEHRGQAGSSTDRRG
jgi:GH15 family glucan-1,4-alpha-glucosidase